MIVALSVVDDRFGTVPVTSAVCTFGFIMGSTKIKENLTLINRCCLNPDHFKIPSGPPKFPKCPRRQHLPRFQPRHV